MLAPISPKKVRRVLKRFRRADRTPCPRGELLKLLISEGGPSVFKLNPTPEDVARLAAINANKAYCVARCGGCALTVGWIPPA